MNSIHTVTNQLDRLDASLRVVTEVYQSAVRCTSEYALELDPTDTMAFRVHLEAIQERIPRDGSEIDWRRTEASFRGELRAYHQKAMERVAGFRAELRDSAVSMRSFADSVAAIGNGSEREIRKSLAELGRVSKSELSGEIGAKVAGVCESIAMNVERMTQRHQLVIAEFRDEVRTLHRYIEVQQRAAKLDASTGIWNRQTLDSHVSKLIESNELFCLLWIRIRNLRQLEAGHSPEVLESAIKELLHRLMRLLGETPEMGRWNEECIAVVLHSEPAAALRVSREASDELSGMYSVQENGAAQAVLMEVTAGIIERTTGNDEPSFHKKLLRMSEAIGTV